jgi:hypothetical protein
MAAVTCLQNTHRPDQPALHVPSRGREAVARFAAAVAIQAACAVLPLAAATAAPPLQAAPPAASAEPPWLEERAKELGVDWSHDAGRTGRYHMPEITGPGLALFDADGDGDLDLFLVQGGSVENPKPGVLGHRLFRNLLVEEGELRFADVTEASGLRACGYGMGAATGDYDNDGRVDLYVTCLGSNQLWHNDGPGPDGVPRFRDVIQAAGADDTRWSVSAAFVDYDRDGFLDLYVGNYLRYAVGEHRQCTTRTGEPDYCGPLPAEAETGRLFRNRGDGTFDDVSGPSGVGAGRGAGLGVSVVDFDADGWPDLYVAHDQMPNHLWMNLRDGTFSDEAMLSGCALSAEGRPLASMGVDAGDFDNDGDLDVVMTNFLGEGMSLYRNGDGLCDEVANSTGLRALSMPFTGFGTAWIDVDNDSWLDLVVVNGAVTVVEEQRRAGDPFPFRQTKQLLRNLGNGRFADATGLGGPGFAVPEVSRGAAFGDLDDDGDTDVVVANLDGPTRVFLNRAGQRRTWLGLRLRSGGRDALGAVVTLERDGAPPLVRHSRADGSFASANDPRVLFGLGDAAAPIRRAVVRWPSGRREAFVSLPTGRYTTLVEGTGAAAP